MRARIWLSALLALALAAPAYTSPGKGGKSRSGKSGGGSSVRAPSGRLSPRLRKAPWLEASSKRTASPTRETAGEPASSDVATRFEA